MKMGVLEKALVNRSRKGASNTRLVRARLDELRPWVGHDALELGGGIGDVSAALARLGYRATSTDADPGQSELAKRRHVDVPGLDFAVEDATALSCGDASFDLVVSQNVFHHIPDWRAAVREIARVLRPGGHLLWLDLTFPRWLKPILRPFEHRAGIYTAEEVRAAFRDAGLVEVRGRRVFHGAASHHDLVIRKDADRSLAA